jgi:hypothetical protein
MPCSPSSSARALRLLAQAVQVHDGEQPKPLFEHLQLFVQPVVQAQWMSDGFKFSRFRCGMLDDHTKVWSGGEYLGDLTVGVVDFSGPVSIV